MESHRCKLCSRLFTNGRALGGHMKAHLTTPAPPPPSSASSSAAADGLKPENPNSSFKFSDPVIHIVLQDRESETESKNPTRKRSKRCRRPPEPVGASPEENLAMCLMMLSRDRRIQNQTPTQKPIRRKKKCQKCTKQFRSYRALFSHEKVCELKTELKEEQDHDDDDDEEEHESFRIFKCPFCSKLFGSGQALGGHKRTHLLSSSTNGGVTVNGSVSLKLEISLIDLNLPAPLEDDDCSAVSDS